MIMWHILNVCLHNLSLHVFLSVFCKAWTSAPWLLKSSHQFLSIKKPVKGTQMSFPAAGFLKSCTNASTGPWGKLQGTRRQPAPPPPAVPVPDGRGAHRF